MIDHLPTVAVIGAGLSGLICARTLADHGFPVAVFEKSRGVGGRMATRRTSEGLRFDHGAQYFTARDRRFQRYVQAWLHDGIIQPWLGRIVVLEEGKVVENKSTTERYVATPGMNSICKHLATNLNVRFQTHVAPLIKVSDRWRVTSVDNAELGDYEIAIVSAPALQTATILQASPQIARLASECPMSGCWALMLALPRPLDVDFDAAFVHNSPISWIARNSSKPGRDTGIETWVAHGSAEWSETHIEESAEFVRESLLSEFGKVTRSREIECSFATAHRWRFAIPTSALSDACLFDVDLKAGVCGDWCAGARVEGAFLSGIAAAGRVMALTD